MESSSKHRPQRRHAARLVVHCPPWLKQRLTEAADDQDRNVSELVREILVARYPKEQSQG